MLISVFVIFIAFSSCDKDETDNETVINDNYYVKYVIHCNYPYLFSNWSVTTPQGKYTKNDYQTRHWEQTYGPIKKDLSVRLKLDAENPPLKYMFQKTKNRLL